MFQENAPIEGSDEEDTRLLPL